MNAHPIEPESWSRRQMGALAAAFTVGTLLRLALLPTEGLRGDLDQFAGWVHHIATNGPGSLYGETAAGPVTFGPVMGILWTLLAIAEPGFGASADAADVTIRIWLKLPAVLADLGIALVVAFALRDRPRWAVLGAAVILLHPAVIDVSAWWGQYESVYALAALCAAVLAVRSRPDWAAVALTAAVLTKPQALPLLVPFAAWYWANGGLGSLARAAGIGIVAAVLVWLPFVGEGGPAGYLRNLATYQGEVFNVLSVRAWNVWWLVQEAAGGGEFIADDAAVLGPVTWRQLGYGIAGLLELAIAVAIIRAPEPRRLVIGLAASVLVVFTFATQMHERYAYGALVFFALLVAEPAGRWLSLAFGAAFTLNLLAAVPPAREIGALLPVAGPLGIAGSLAMLAITYAAVRWSAARSLDRAAAQAPPGP